MQIYQPSRQLSVLTSALLSFSVLVAIAKPVVAQSISLSNITGNVSIQGVRAGLWRLLPSVGGQSVSGNNKTVDSNKIIKIESNGQAVLECGNKQKHVLGAGDHPVSRYCPAGNARNIARGADIPEQNFIDQAMFAATQVSEDFPALGNTAFLNVESLSQRHPTFADLAGNNLAIYGYKEEAENIEFIESLMPGGYYYYPYFGDGEDTSVATSFVFNILPETEAAVVLTQVATIKSQDLEADEQAIALAMLYLDYEYQPNNPTSSSFSLNSLALEVLNERIEAGSEHLPLYLLQAEAYMAMGLLDEAKLTYGQILSLATETGKVEYQAAIHELLGDIANAEMEFNRSFSESETVQYHWQTALSLHQQLGNLEQIDVIQDKLNNSPL